MALPAYATIAIYASGCEIINGKYTFCTAFIPVALPCEVQIQYMSLALVFFQLLTAGVMIVSGKVYVK